MKGAAPRTTTITVGLFSIGLAAYWPQFPGLREQLAGYGSFVGERLRSLGATVVDAGMVDDQPAAARAAERFVREDVDLIVCYVTTYATSSQVVSAVQRVRQPVLVLNLQPTPQLAYAATGTGEWLANCQACCVPEIANAFARCDIPFHTVTGLLGLPEQTPGALADEATADYPAARRAWAAIEQWLAAAAARRALARGRIGFLGHTYPGMLDLYSDFTQQTGQFGTHIEVLEMEDLDARVEAVTPDEVRAQREETLATFVLSEDDPSDPLVTRPDPAVLDWSYRVAAGLDRLARDFGLDGLAYYHRGLDDNRYERLGAGLILGCSLLTARGVPCSGEGDLKNCLAMKVLDTLGAGGSFTELYALDYAEQCILMGHDGPFHLAIAEGRPMLRGLGLFHGKRGGGIAVEARVKQGPITILGLTQTRDGRLAWRGAEGWSLPGETLRIGNTNSRLRFTTEPDGPFDVADWMNRWADRAPTHHVALGVGHQLGAIAKFSRLTGTELVTIGPRGAEG